jgi:putative membrane protein
MMMYWGNGTHGMQWEGWLLAILAMIAFWGVIIGGVWYLVAGQTRRPKEDSRSQGDALRILDERLARGEINPEEYRRLLDMIDYSGVRSGQPPAGGQR